MKTAMEQGWDEREVTVDRLKLLETLRSNREKHIKEYEEAVKGYKEQALRRLERLRSSVVQNVEDNFIHIKRKILEFDPENPLRDRITIVDVTSFDLQVPRSYARSYEVAIQMAEWEVSDKITLKQSQFQCFVLDDWDWKNGFETMTKMYK